MKKTSTRPVADKLGIKKGSRVAVLHSPKGYGLAKVDFATRLSGEPFDVVQAFYENERALKSDLPKLKKAIVPSGKIWVCWRKGNVTDLSRDAIWALGDKVGLDSVASCAIDDHWSALNLMLPKDQRKAKSAKRRA